MSENHILIVTSTRAEWGLLRPLCLELLKLNANFKLLVTGSHLDEHGDNSVKEIDEIFNTRMKLVNIVGEAHEPTSMINIISNGVVAYETILKELNPKLVVVLGDRYEIMAMAWVCRLLGIPLAHFSGGELTLGAFDDTMRHCITKLSDYHFVAEDEHFNRVRQLGENPEHIFNVGELAFYGLGQMKFKTNAELSKEFDFDFSNFFLATVHPETCRVGEGMKITKAIIEGTLSSFSEARILFTSANLDPEGLEINEFLINYQKTNPRLKFIRTLGRLNYLSAALLSNCVIGNSSSGVLEIPALGVPVVNVGDRQKGRAQDKLVKNAQGTKESILKSIKSHMPFTKRKNIMANDSAKKAAAILISLTAPPRAKPFFDLE